jgi:hypothetical protein
VGQGREGFPPAGGRGCRLNSDDGIKAYKEAEKHWAGSDKETAGTFYIRAAICGLLAGVLALEGIETQLKRIADMEEEINR